MDPAMTALVVTTISKPNDVLRALAAGAQQHGWPFFVIGDEKSPDDFEIPGATFVSVEQKLVSGDYPLSHYARKNIGYMLAMRAGADVIVETDDDNMPLESFWRTRSSVQRAVLVRVDGWLNVYRYLIYGDVWPRGFPLDLVNGIQPEYSSFEGGKVYCPIQQGMAAGNPDLDAIQRLKDTISAKYPPRVIPLPIALEDSWCPFNSQNTTWEKEAFPLLYLPSFCSFRMTDIWRSFIAQRIAYANGWSILFHGATVRQDRNEHDLMKDFELEIPGYLHNAQIREALLKLDIPPGTQWLCHNLRACYEALIATGIMDERELPLLEQWIGEFQ